MGDSLGGFNNAIHCRILRKHGHRTISLAGIKGSKVEILQGS